jgi:hypothetical protein
MTLTSFFLAAGLVIPALAILLLAFAFSRTRSGSIVCGIMAAILMGLQCLFLWVAIGSGEAWSGRTSASDIPGYLRIGCVVVLFVYFAATNEPRHLNVERCKILRLDDREWVSESGGITNVMVRQK